MSHSPMMASCSFLLPSPNVDVTLLWADIMFPCGNSHGCSGNVVFRVFLHMNKMLSLHPAPMGICWTERPCRWCMSAMSLMPLVPRPTHAMSCPHQCQINVIKVPHQHLPHHAIQLHINAMSFTNKDVDVARGH